MGASKTLKQAYTRQNDLTNTYQGLGGSLTGQAQDSFNTRNSLIKQPTDFYSSLASGDPTKMLAAAAPGISNISKSAQSAKGAIYDTVPAGAGRQFSLGQLERDKFSKGADFLNQAYMSSFPALQGIASDTGNFGLQQLGGGMNSFQGAMQGNQGVIQSETQRQAAKMNMIGSLAGIAGGAIGGFGGGAKPKPAAPSGIGWG